MTEISYYFLKAKGLEDNRPIGYDWNQIALYLEINKENAIANKLIWLYARHAEYELKAKTTKQKIENIEKLLQTIKEADKK